MTDWLNRLSVSDIHFVTTYYVNSAIYPMTNKGRKHHGFIFTLKGTETYHFENRDIVAVPNSVLYLPKESGYSITLEGEESVVLLIDFELHSSEEREAFCVCFGEDASVGSLFAEAERVWNLKGSDCPSVSKSIFYRICSRLIRKCESCLNTDSYALIEESVKYLHRHYLENSFRIEHLSEIAKISSRYYEKLFYQKFGMTPKEYVLNLKMERGKELLLCEKNMVRDVAFQLGYSDIYHFGKMFKAKTGYTPSQYRNAHL